MTFFSKISNVWRTAGFKESDGMKNLKEKYNLACSEEKTLENELVMKKREKNHYKTSYQHECPHLTMEKSKGGQSINDYFAKCTHCSAEIYDHAGCINYLNSLIDLLNKSPKMVESYKLYLEDKDKSISKDTGYIFHQTQQLIKDLIVLRAEIAEIKSNKFNDALKKNLIEK
jgi:hypothetical protein